MGSLGTAAGAIAVFFATLFGVMLARGKLKKSLGEHYVLDNTVIGVALIPVLLWLLGTSSLKSLDAFGVKVEAAERAIDRATSAPVGPQVTGIAGEHLPVDSVSTFAKGGVSNVPEFIRRRIQALSLQLGESGYYAEAIREYLMRLTAVPFFRYLVIVDRDNRLVGLSDATQIGALLREGTPQDFDAQALVDALAGSDVERLPTLLPGYLPADAALDKDTDKRTALKRMDERGVQYLPVVDAAGRFVGVADRSRLTASILVDVADRLEANR